MDAELSESRKALALIAKQVAGCKDCALCQGRTRVVPGEGDPDADIMFIGEGPGFYEDQQGRPFVGASGKFLDDLLRLIGLDRKTVFITNVVKCRPPTNRDPQPDEIAACGTYLDAQIAAIKPRVIVTLGRHSMQRYFPGEAISRIHGQPRRKDGLIIVPMYHPAAALHQGNLRAIIEADFRRLPDFLAKTIGGGDVAATAQAPVPASPPAPAQGTVPAHLARASVGAAALRNGTTETADPSPPESSPAEPQQMRLLL